MLDPGLEGKVAIVTGANHGIGAATSRALAAQGARVFCSYLRRGASGADPDAPPGAGRYVAERSRDAAHVVEGIRSFGGAAEALEIDLSRPGAATEVFDRAETAFGPVSVLVNNASHWQPDTFVPYSEGTLDHFFREVPLVSADSHDRSFAVNSRAVALLTAEFARRHVDRGATWGRVVNVSTGGAGGFPGEVSYGASKAALESYTRAAAKELGRYGITVNAVSPGPIQTGYIDATLEQRLIPQTPLGRLGQPADVADVIAFLASDQARWITGAVVPVGGGHMM